LEAVVAAHVVPVPHRQLDEAPLQRVHVEQLRPVRN
jgi:hypothetical protein